MSVLLRFHVLRLRYTCCSLNREQGRVLPTGVRAQAASAFQMHRRRGTVCAVDDAMSPDLSSADPMHLCFLCAEYPPAPHGGIGVFTKTLAEALVARGHMVTVVGCYLGTAADTEETVRGVRVIRLAQTGPRRLSAFTDGLRVRARIGRVHREAPIHVLEGSEMSLVLAPRLAGARRIIRLHGGHAFYASLARRKPKPLRLWMERRSLAKADSLLAVSAFVARVTAEHHPIDVALVRTVYNGVDTDAFGPRDPGSRDGAVIMFVGTLCEKKGVRALVEAMPLVLQRHPGAVLHLVGRDTLDEASHGSYIASVLDGVDAAARDAIRIRGAVPHDQLPEVMSECTVAVYPSHAEAMGIACVEGLAMGVPCIVPEGGPGPELVVDGISGLHCNPTSPRSIADAIIRFLDDTALGARCATAGRRTAEERFSLARQVVVNERLYEQLVLR